MVLRLVCFLICGTLTSSCYGSEPSDTVCVDGAAAAKNENYERAMNTWAEASIDASAKLRLRAVIGCLEWTGIAENNASAAAWIIARADEGIVQAALYSGLLYGAGVGVEADVDTAVEWLDKAAAKGSEAAAFIGEKLKSVSEQ
jgi:TPR repeat protein